MAHVEYNWRPWSASGFDGAACSNTVTDSEATISSRPNQSKMILPVGNGSGRPVRVFHSLDTAVNGYHLRPICFPSFPKGGKP
jgi:hypothetical protein